MWYNVRQNLHLADACCPFGIAVGRYTDECVNGLEQALVPLLGQALEWSMLRIGGMFIPPFFIDHTSRESSMANSRTRKEDRSCRKRKSYSQPRVWQD